MNFHSPMRLLLAASLAIGLIVTTGCGKKVLTHPVSGKVLMADGSPAGSGIIKFRTTSEEGAEVKASGMIQPDGSFQLSTFEDGDGALVGEHQVILFSPALGDGNGAQRVVSFPTKYRKYDTSGLKFQVSPGENDFVVQLEAR